MEVRLLVPLTELNNRANFKVDVIIPAFNAQKTIDRCLASIAMQTIRKDLRVTIVDDAGEDNYDQAVNRWKDYLDIQVLRYEKNGGPGVARQYGVDHTDYPLMCFIDADDTFNGAYALQQLREPFYQLNEAIAVWGSFTEETVGGNFVKHNPAPIWMFGKMYRRDFWKKNNIRFHATSRYNEDSGVNATIWLLQNEKEHILMVDDLDTYYWHNNGVSITKGENTVQDYWDGRGFYGFVENRIYTMSNVFAHKQPDTESIDYILQSLGHMYCYYNSAYGNKHPMLKDIIGLMEEFYEKFGEAALQIPTPEQLVGYYHAAIRSNAPFIPVIGWWEFLQQLKDKTLGSEIDFSEVGTIDPSRTQYA